MNHYEWDNACLTHSTAVFQEISTILERGYYPPDVFTTNFLVLRVLQGVDNPLEMVNFNDMFLQMNALIGVIRSAWLWVCFYWKSKKLPVPVVGSEGKYIHEVWLAMLKKQCFPPYRKKRCRRIPAFFHDKDTDCSFCNPPFKIPDHYHCLELLYLHAWALLCEVKWEAIISYAMKTPFTVYQSPHISFTHQFTLFKLFIEDELNDDELLATI